MKLTEVDFWNNYWGKISLPSEINMSHSFDRCLARELKDQLTYTSGDIFEIGCAPGKWLAYIWKECGLKPSGIEYSEPGMNATLKNFHILKIPSGQIIDGDFFKKIPDHLFDVVMSLGFIEHFDNVDEVVDLHLQWLKPGGTLILGVPNFNGITKNIQRILDQSILDKHNLQIMNLSYFEELGKKHKLEKIAIKYLGSFEPDLPIPKYKYGSPLQIIIKILLFVARIIRRFEVFDNFNSPYYSSYILAIYRKREF